MEIPALCWQCGVHKGIIYPAARHVLFVKHVQCVCYVAQSAECLGTNCRLSCVCGVCVSVYAAVVLGYNSTFETFVCAG